MHDLQHQLYQKTAQLAALREIGRVINAAWELKVTLELITRKTAEVMGMDSCSIYLLDEAGEHLILEATTGLAAESIGRARLRLGPETTGVRVETYGDVGDYAASGLDGAEVHIHGDGQDQVGQILKDGKLVIHGDVGQTFLYGAKGGTIYVLGSAAGRPLINAVGRPRAVINGTCLNYLAESFMAGDPLDDGGFVILNGVTFDQHGRLVELETPYPGGNLFSLASGGAVYLRDPRRKVGEDQLNGGQFAPLAQADWPLIRPYLEENERLFGITVRALLTVDNEERPPAHMYRKVEVRPLAALA